MPSVDLSEPAENPAVPASEQGPGPRAARSDAALAVRPQTGGGACGCGCGGGGDVADAFVYALGRIVPRFSSLGVEKEFAQATGRAATDGLSDRQALYAVLTARENRYLARQLCWVLTIEGLETYLLQGRGSDDLDLLIESVRQAPRPTDVDVVIGVRGGVAPPEACNGLLVPVVRFEQIYSFDVEGLLGSIPRPQGADEGKFTAAAEDLFARVVQVTDNAGATDEDRALNYLALRYPKLYAHAAEAYDRNQSLTAVETRPSAIGVTRRIVDVILTFTDRRTDVAEKFFVRVDVTEMFPFLVTKLTPFLDR